MWRSLAGSCVVEITCASISEMLSLLHKSGMILHEIKMLDELHIRVSVCRKDLQQLCALVRKHGANIDIVKKTGMYWMLVSCRNRVVLLVGIFLVMLLSVYLPTRVLFIDVRGNTSIPQNMILETAERCGLYFGAARECVRSEAIKNMLLAELNSLQWVGVNTHGCVATIHVKEREAARTEQENNGVGRIVAKRDGIINEITVTKGNPQCKVGQAVKTGQTLVSGYTDIGLAIKAEMPQAEIYATTAHRLTLYAPTTLDKRTKKTGERVQYYLRFGKNIINFCKGSGISGTSCVKMYKENKFKLSSGFELPVSLIKVQISDYELIQDTLAEEASFRWVSGHSRDYLIKQMTSGRIVGSEESIQIANGLCLFEGKYVCSEMIGQVQSEEIVVGNGERN